MFHQSKTTKASSTHWLIIIGDHLKGNKLTQTIRRQSNILPVKAILTETTILNSIFWFKLRTHSLDKNKTHIMIRDHNDNKNNNFKIKNGGRKRTTKRPGQDHKSGLSRHQHKTHCLGILTMSQDDKNNYDLITTQLLHLLEWTLLYQNRPGQ